MAIVKHKHYKAVTTDNARAITSVIVPLREKNRAPQLALQEFRKRTINIFLYPGVFCPISELPKTMAYIVNIWRKILNNDIRYQQKQDNLPSFLGVRDTCVKFSTPELLTDADRIAYSEDFDQIVYPYLRVTIDNAQVGAFIIMKWCAHTGQTPHRFEYIRTDKKRKTPDFEDFFKCSPLYIEQLLQDKAIDTITFGGASKITTEYVNRNTDLYNVPGIRVSQKFGTNLTIYSTRKLQRIREEQAKGTLERIRRGKVDKAIDAIEWKKLVARRKYSAINNAQLFDSYKYKCYSINNFYSARRENLILRPACWDAEQTDKELAQMYARELLEQIPGAEQIINEFEILRGIARASMEKRKEAEERVREVERRLAIGKLQAEHNIKFNTQKGLRNYVCKMFTMPEERDTKDTTIDSIAVVEAVKILTKYFNVEVDHKSNKILLK